MSENVEHFVTLFDSGFLPQGMALYESLEDQGEPFLLWVLCMDEAVVVSLAKLDLPHVRIIRLTEVEAEHPELLAVKPGRSRAEYCWTLTSFSIEAVLQRAPSAERVTYIDADLCFFGPPSALLSDMDRTGSDVLLTDHAYAPEYAQESTSGRFCVQFLPFRNNERGKQILSWWRERCLEWCFARFEDGKFGDQKYLDDWLERWAPSATAVTDPHLTLAPWNASHLYREGHATSIYHFHNLRIFDRGIAKLWHSYFISVKVRKRFYKPYVKRIRKALRSLDSIGARPTYPPSPSGFIDFLKRAKRIWRGTEGWSRV